MGLKENNEVTLNLTSTIKEFVNFIEAKGYKYIESFNMKDYYFIPSNLEIKKLSVREILANAILVRDVTLSNAHYMTLTYKLKKIDDDGNILSQNSTNCDVLNIDDAKAFLSAIGYCEIMMIEEEDKIYNKNGFEFALKNIVDGDNLIEIETNDTYDTIDKIKVKILEEKLPIDSSNYFVKKAEVALAKTLEIE